MEMIFNALGRPIFTLEIKLFRYMVFGDSLALHNMLRTKSMMKMIVNWGDPS